MVIKCKRCREKVETKYSGTKYCKRCSSIVRSELKQLRYQKKKEAKAALNKAVKKEENVKQHIVTDKKYPRPMRGYGISICWYCENAYGGCSWTAIDSTKNTIQYKPVEGWDAKKTKYNANDFSYMVYDCPLFKEG